MGRSVKATDATTVAGIAEHHNDWISNNAIDYGSNPLDLLIRAEEGKALIVVTGVCAWPYPGQDRELEHPIDPRYPHADPSLPPVLPRVGPCECCNGSKNRNRWCAVCRPSSPGVKPLPKDPPKKYTGNQGGMKGGIGA